MTYNLLTIASFRIGVPSILFIVKNPNMRCVFVFRTEYINEYESNSKFSGSWPNISGTYGNCPVASVNKVLSLFLVHTCYRIGKKKVQKKVAKFELFAGKLNVFTWPTKSDHIIHSL